MPAVYRIQLLGELRVQIGDRSLTRFRTQKIASLLAYLAYYRHQQHPREVLLELLWPDCEPAVGRSRLSNAVWSLRRQLEPPGTPAGSILQTTHFAIGLNPAAVITDVAEFLHTFRKAARATAPAERLALLRQAAQIYQGQLLPGFYEDWVLTEQRRLDDLYEQVRHLLEAADLKTGTVTSDLAGLPEAEPAVSAALPASFTRFFGREAELTRLQEWLSPQIVSAPCPRLITLTGAGGTGKTRLSLEVARRLQPLYHGAVWFVSLVSLRDPRLIGSSLVEAMALPRAGNVEPLEQVVSFLNNSGQPALLVLDNFEQVVEGGAESVQTLLERVPTLMALATSRRLLNLSAEREFVLRPLPTPQGGESLEGVSRYESVKLFLDRAQRVRPDFQLTARNASAVAALCHRLEGIPLAIELAAARIQALTPAQMLSLMERRFDFLVSKKRDAAERHQSLWTALDWSYRLLSPELQTFFCRLSVFCGGWTLEAAEVICEEPQAWEYLEQLIEWSLVQAEETGSGMRFRMLETLREYARERQDATEREVCGRRHVDYFLSLAEQAEPLLEGSEQAAWFERLEAEHDNLRAAFAFSLDKSGRSPACPVSQTEKLMEEGVRSLRFSGALQSFWIVRGHLAEGRDWYTAALGQPGAEAQTQVRANVLNRAGMLASMQGDYAAARSLFEESLSIMRAIGDKHGISLTLHFLGFLARERGAYATARSLFGEAMVLNREMGDRAGIAALLLNLGVVAHCQGDKAAARSLFEESLSIVRETGDRNSIAWSLNWLGRVALEQADYVTAQAYQEEALLLQRELGQRQVAYTLCLLGNVATARGDYAAARSLFEESLSLGRESEDKQSIANALGNLGGLAREQGDYPQARACLAERLTICRELGDKRAIAESLEMLASLAASEAQWKVVHQGQAPCEAKESRTVPAARLWGAAERLREQIDVPLPLNLREEYDRQVAQAREVLGEEAFAISWEAGRAMTWEQAAAYALEDA